MTDHGQELARIEQVASDLDVLVVGEERLIENDMGKKTSLLEDDTPMSPVADRINAAVRAKVREFAERAEEHIKTELCNNLRAGRTDVPCEKCFVCEKAAEIRKLAEGA